MIDPATLVAYVLVVLGLFLIPGPAVLLVLARAMSGGRRVGIATGLGIALGDLVHATMATFGLSAVLMTSATAFSIVKYAGAGYLIYLGIRAFFEKPRGLEFPTARTVEARYAFRQAILTEVLNPKTALFFLAFLPQFVDVSRGGVGTQILGLGLVFMLLGTITDGLYAVTAGTAAAWLRGSPRLLSSGRWVSGGMYVGLGLAAALASGNRK